jgi:hypothetical protein
VLVSSRRGKIQRRLVEDVARSPSWPRSAVALTFRASDHHRYVLKALTNRCKRMIVSDEPVVEVRAM